MSNSRIRDLVMRTPLSEAQAEWLLEQMPNASDKTLQQVVALACSGHPITRIIALVRSGRGPRAPHS
ncbi:hypothetical protein [Deinococcus wulumuqiensis]|uniref:Uncharacterized protein n=1 Tax=Deinococcus wulumuqiensis TaxID=980427 RepID=A0AAV4K148_9DEIO|nr:hypothetical protein [Deinococcus wulumuqiensis]GGI75324.1 hypothetical protein GCM10010914_06920 [Deinococcus wulumuqiensis]GGP28708.1 hypothetical protein GCM10008021_03590 [Deinococcus wulumuqiensis]